MKSFYFNSEEHVIQYIEYLIESKNRYHFDDDPMDVFRHADALTMRDNNNRLWDYCDPWVFFDNHPDLWDRYTQGGTIEQDV
jgi:hypothetical protein